MKYPDTVVYSAKSEFQFDEFSAESGPIFQDLAEISPIIPVEHQTCSTEK